MNDLHKAWLLLGSNIEPETHLRKAIQLLRAHGRVTMISRAWESSAVGREGPNFLNACLLLLTQLPPDAVIDTVIRPVERELGRVRSDDQFAPRSIDVDLLLYDAQTLRPDYWEQAFAMVPLAELIPNLGHPLTGETLAEAAHRLRSSVWIAPRPEVLEGIQSIPAAGLDP